MIRWNTDRRNFLKAAGALGAAAMMRPGFAWSADGDTLRIRMEGDIQVLDPAFMLGAIEDVIINGVNGWQYETGEEFCDAVKALASDPQLRKSMGQAALESSRQFSTEVFYERVMKVYEATLKGPRNHRASLPVKLRRKLYQSVDENLDLNMDDWNHLGTSRF